MILAAWLVVLYSDAAPSKKIHKCCVKDIERVFKHVLCCFVMDQQDLGYAPSGFDPDDLQIAQMFLCD